MVLPTQREPEWSTTQTRISVSTQTSTKWLPEPRVPSCLTARFTSSPSVLGMGLSRNHCSDLPVRARPDSPRPFLPCSRPTPAGIERPNSPTNGDRSSGSSSRVLVRRTAIMPHPMSTPTAAGMMVSRWVGITLPTVAPLPMWASGIRATCPATPGARESISAWRRVPSSSMLAQFLTSPMVRTSRQSRRHVVSGSEGMRMRIEAPSLSARWSGWPDLNRRPPRPERGALPTGPHPDYLHCSEQAAQRQPGYGPKPPAHSALKLSGLVR